MNYFGGSSQLPAGGSRLDADEEAVLTKLAGKVVDRGFTVPAILFLESVKPLNYIGSQALVFFEPIVQTLFSFKEYDTFRTALEKRESIEILIQKIEAGDAIAHAKEKRYKAYLKEQRKTWKWYQRWLGIFTPKVIVPDEVLDPPPSKDKK